MARFGGNKPNLLCVLRLVGIVTARKRIIVQDVDVTLYASETFLVASGIDLIECFMEWFWKVDSPHHTVNLLFQLVTVNY